MPLVKPSTILYYICKYSKFSCIKNKKRGENSLLFKYCVGELGILPFITLYGRKTSVTNMQEVFGGLQTSFISYNREENTS